MGRQARAALIFMLLLLGACSVVGTSWADRGRGRDGDDRGRGRDDDEIRAEDERVRFRTRLTGATNASGHAKFEERSDRRKFSTEVQNIAPGTVIDVVLHRNGETVTLGSATANQFGVADLNLDSRNGDNVPVLQPTDSFSVSVGGQELLKGSFGDAPGGSLDDNSPDDNSPSNRSNANSGGSSNDDEEGTYFIVVRSLETDELVARIVISLHDDDIATATVYSTGAATGLVQRGAWRDDGDNSFTATTISAGGEWPLDVPETGLARTVYHGATTDDFRTIKGTIGVFPLPLPEGSNDAQPELLGMYGFSGARVVAD